MGATNRGRDLFGMVRIDICGSARQCLWARSRERACEADAFRPADNYGTERPMPFTVGIERDGPWWL